MNELSLLLTGAIAAGHGIIGLFFLRFWTRTRDGLFLAFAAAFWLLAVNQLISGLYGGGGDQQALVYLLRLAAFGLIILAIVRKNMKG